MYNKLKRTGLDCPKKEELLGASVRYLGETHVLEDRGGQARDLLVFDVKSERILDRDEYFNLD